MKVLSPERMAAYDQYAIKTWGIPSAVLMENAGRNTYRLMKEKGYLAGRNRIAVVCGRGNNGGDGFVIARYALLDGLTVIVFLLCKKEDLKGDAELNMGLFSSLGGEIIEYGDNLHATISGLKHAQIIVDAMFGTGLSKPVGGREKAVIEAINLSEKPVIAVDIPSGIDGKTGAPLGDAVKATHTFTFAYPKLGHLIYPGAYYTGKLSVIDISIPSDIEDKLGTDADLIDGPILRGFMKERLPWSHKGTYGHTAVIAGSIGKTGAAYMTSLAALKIGAGLVSLAIPSSLNAIMEMKLTEAMTHPVNDNGTGHFILSSYEEIVSFLEDKDVAVIGPGLSREAETMEIVRRLVTAVDKPLVIDADGINAFQGHLDLLKSTKRRSILITPHPGELARILGITAQEANGQRITIGKEFVEQYGINLLLKGARSILFTPDGNIFINPTGNPALAKGGSGDILTGLIGGLLSQGYTVAQSGMMGAYLHGYMADRWSEVNGDADLLASDLLEGLGKAIKEIRNGEERVYIEKSF